MTDEDSSAVMLDMNSLETEAARLLIPFLRTASLMKHYIYKLGLPEIKEDDEEFDQLVKFLDLVVVKPEEETEAMVIKPEEEEEETEAMEGDMSCHNFAAEASTAAAQRFQGIKNVDVGTSAIGDYPCDYCQETFANLLDIERHLVGVHGKDENPVTFAAASTAAAARCVSHVHIIDVVQWFSPGGAELKIWCSEFATLACQDHLHLARQAMRVNVLWKQPQLLKLHQNFDQIFQFYQKRPCDKCNKVPKDPSVCLMCGTMVCMREPCCKQTLGTQTAFETVKHSQDCGGGTGIFLQVNSSTIIVVRGKRACVWGSVFLDHFGEEDKELKRGKPLFLNEKRYQLLEHQWVSHKFDHTNKRWVPHRDSL